MRNLTMNDWLATMHGIRGKRDSLAALTQDTDQRLSRGVYGGTEAPTS